MHVFYIMRKNQVYIFFCWMILILQLQETKLSVVLTSYGVSESDLTPSEVVLRILGEDAMYGLYTRNSYLPLELFDDDALDER